jgi:hypothetical protein
MSLEACPHCHEQVHKTEDGCGTERCQARRAFVRQAAIHVFAKLTETRVTESQVMGWADGKDAWNMAEKLWSSKPEGC